MPLRRLVRSTLGFSTIDMLAAMAVIATVAAMSVPALQESTDSMRLGMAVRDVERELHTARLTAVSSNRPMRIRFNCPAAAELRMVELIGTPQAPDAKDAAADRCSEAVYPYRPTGPDLNRLTRPNNDGPVRRLQPGTTFTAATTLEFWPDGSVHADEGAGAPWPRVGAAGATITLTRKGLTKAVTVNALGKVTLAN